MKKYAVIGNPIQHSWSPFIHQQFAKQTKIDLTYEALKLDCPSQSDFQDALQQLLEQGYQGLNITLPYKIWAFEVIQKKHGLSNYAEKAGAVNTLTFINSSKWLGNNTDGIGLVRDVKHRLGWSLNKSNVLILGAGGAVSGVMPALIDEKPACIHLLNRDRTKADDLAKRFSTEDCNIRRIDQSEKIPYHLIINGTSSSLWEQLPSTIQQVDPQNAHCYDMVYASSHTPFLHWALANQAKAVSDGLGMLVEQAAESFYQWHHQMPETHIVIEQLRQRL